MVGPVTMPPREKEPQRGGEDSLGDDTRGGGLERMNRRGLWAAGVVLILLVVGAGVLSVGTGYAKDENAKDGDAGAKCSEATLDGTYLFAYDGFEIKGNEKVPFASAGYEVYDGNGNVKGVASTNVNGKVTRNEPFSGTYTVKADCTGTSTYTDGTRYDEFIAPDGSMFTWVQTKPPEFVTAAVELRGTAKRVGE
jgi:hypothetical protein